MTIITTATSPWDDEVRAVEIGIVPDSDPRLDGRKAARGSLVRAAARRRAARPRAGHLFGEQIRGQLLEEARDVAHGDQGRVVVAPVEQDLDRGVVVTGHVAGEARRKNDDGFHPAFVEELLDAGRAVEGELQIEIGAGRELSRELPAERGPVLVHDRDRHVLDVEGDGIAEEDDHEDGQADRQVKAPRIAADVDRFLPCQGGDTPDHAVPAWRMAATKTCSREAFSAPANRILSSRGEPRAMITPAEMIAIR
jgi:hypothetical protein